MIKIPRLSRSQPVGPAPADQITVGPTNAAASAAKGMEGFGKIAEGVGSIIEKAENEHIQTLVNQAIVARNTWEEEQLYGVAGKDGKQGTPGIKDNKGDPTVLFSNLKTRGEEFSKQLIDPNWDHRTRMFVSRALAKEESRIREKRAAMYSTMSSAYNKGIENAAVNIKGRDIPNLAAGYTAKPSQGRNRFNDALMEMRSIRIMSAINKGGAFKHTGEPLREGITTIPYFDKDEKGRNVQAYAVITDPRVYDEISKDMSKVIESSARTFISSGDKDKYNALISNLGHWVDPKTRGELDRALDKQGVKREAFKEVTRVFGLPEDDRMDAMKGITDPELQQETMRLYDERNRFIKNDKDRRADETYDDIVLALQSARNSGQGLTTVTELETHPLYQKYQSNLKAKHIKALQDFVVNPEVSDPAAKMNLYNIMASDDLRNLSYSQLVEKMSGLNTEDRRRIEGWWKEDVDQSSSQQRARRRTIFAETKRIAELHQLVKKLPSGKYRKKDKIYLMQLQDNIYQDIKGQPMSDEGTVSEIRRAIGLQIRENAKEQGTYIKLPSTRTTISNQSDFNKMTTAERQNAIKRYTNVHGKAPKTQEDLVNWLELQKKAE